MTEVYFLLFYTKNMINDESMNSWKRKMLISAFTIDYGVSFIINLIFMIWNSCQYYNNEDEEVKLVTLFLKIVFGTYSPFFLMYSKFEGWWE